MKSYTPPTLVDFGDAAALTADSRSNGTDDVMFDENGQPQHGGSGSNDVCATPGPAECAG